VGPAGASQRAGDGDETGKRERTDGSPATVTELPNEGGEGIKDSAAATTVSWVVHKSSHSGTRFFGRRHLARPEAGMPNLPQRRVPHRL